MRCIVVRCLAMVLTVVLAGCATMSGAASLPKGDTKNWVTHRVDVGDQVVQFTIPPGESPDWPAFEIPKRIDLKDPDVFDRANAGSGLLRRFWDYRTSRIAQVDGTLRAYVLLWQSEKTLDDTAALQAAVEENAELTRIKDVMQGGSGGPHDVMRFEPAVVGGRAGLLIHHQTSPAHYAVTLDAHHYLTIYVNGSSVTRPGWREDARAAADAILGSIRIEPKRIGEHSEPQHPFGSKPEAE